MDKQPILIKSFTSVAYKIPTVQYGSVDVASSTSLEFSADASEAEKERAIQEAKVMLHKVFKEVVEPDIQSKKKAYDPTGQPTANPAVMAKGVLLTDILAETPNIEKLQADITFVKENKPGFSQAEVKRLVKMLEDRIAKLQEE